MTRWNEQCACGSEASTRILRRRFPETCETVGQVFKFAWILRWKINAVCMSLSTFVSFQSRFVTYLLNFPRISQIITLHFRLLSCCIILASVAWFDTFCQNKWLHSFSVTLGKNLQLQKHQAKVIGKECIHLV